MKHVVHSDHLTLYGDIRSGNYIKEKCHTVHTEFPESSHNISEKRIFYEEIARLVFFLFYQISHNIYFSITYFRRCRYAKSVNVKSQLNFKTMKRNLNRIKNGPRPKIPENAAELTALFEDPDVFYKYGMNLNQTAPRYFATVVTDDYSFCVLQSNSVIEFVKSHIEPSLRNYLIDGTFSCVPRGFYQLLVISIEYRNDVSFKFLSMFVVFVLSLFKYSIHLDVHR